MVTAQIANPRYRGKNLSREDLGSIVGTWGAVIGKNKRNEIIPSN